MLLGAPGLTTRNEKLLVTKGITTSNYHRETVSALCWTTSNKKLLGAPGINTRSKDATRGSWPYY